MLQLNAEQVLRLQALKLERDVAQLSQVLADGFTEVPGRLGERYSLLIQHGVQRGATHGLVHAVCVARYLACWFMLGAEFENKPGFEWAAEILASRQRDQGAKVFQLCRRTREELARLTAQPGPVPAAMAPAAFDAAIARLDTLLMPRGTLGSLLPPQKVQLGEACDIDALDLRVQEAGPALRYLLAEGQWRRMPVALERSPITLAAGAGPTAGGRPAALPLGKTAPPPPKLPARLNLLASPSSQQPNRLRLRTRAAACCDPQVHPQVVLNSNQGLMEWRGPHTQDILLSLLPAPASPPEDDALQPVIAMETPVQLSQLSLSSCGLRDSGTSLGDLSTLMAVHAGEQHLVAWRRDNAQAMSWPESPTPPTAPVSRLRLEREGVPLDATRWQVGLEDLDRQLLEGLSRLATAWEREGGVSKGTLQAEPRVLSGSAAITWGWAESPLGLATAPTFRVAGMLDVIACQLNLRLSGALKLQGSLSRLHLHCGAAETLKVDFERTADSADLLAAVAGAQTSFRHPFVLDLEVLAQDELAVLSLGGPTNGAIVGSCGVRQRPQGAGLQWFAKIAVEPASVKLHLHDPLLGETVLTRALLPAMTLLDWSLG